MDCLLLWNAGFHFCLDEIAIWFLDGSLYSLINWNCFHSWVHWRYFWSLLRLFASCICSYYKLKLAEWERRYRLSPNRYSNPASSRTFVFVFDSWLGRSCPGRILGSSSLRSADPCWRNCQASASTIPRFCYVFLKIVHLGFLQVETLFLMLNSNLIILGISAYTTLIFPFWHHSFLNWAERL